MGFYTNSNSNDGNEEFKPRRRRDSFRWVGAIVLSALVGSGATLASTSLLGHSNSQAGQTAMSSTNVSPTSVSNVSVNVNSSITQVVKRVEPDVVAVVNYTTTSDYFSQQQQTQAADIGSGVYFHNDNKYAYIATNNHVVQGGTKVEVVLQSGKRVQAQIVGTDPYTDLAVLKVPVTNFSSVQPVQFANSDDIQVGEPAIAIGTPMGLDFADTVTSGIISGKKRMMPVEEPTSQQTLDNQAVIQTDAAINPGNSGGPLLNIQGQVVGINSSKIVQSNFEGMGFAIPSNQVQAITAEILQTGHAVHPSIGISGVSLASIPAGYGPNVPVDYGVLVESVTSSDAKTAGLKQGDVIVAVNGQTVQTISDLRTSLFQSKPGDQVSLTVYRGSQRLSMKVKVGEQTAAVATGSSSDSSSGNGFGGYGSGSGSGSGSTDPFGGSNGFGW